MLLNLCSVFLSRSLSQLFNRISCNLSDWDLRYWAALILSFRRISIRHMFMNIIAWGSQVAGKIYVSIKDEGRLQKFFSTACNIIM